MAMVSGIWGESRERVCFGKQQPRGTNLERSSGKGGEGIRESVTRLDLNTQFLEHDRVDFEWNVLLIHWLKSNRYKDHTYIKGKSTCHI